MAPVVLLPPVACPGGLPVTEVGSPGLLPAGPVAAGLLDAAAGWAGLSVPGLAALALAAVLVGFAKTAIGGVGLVSVALFATVLPARESTGALLPLLLVGDVVAVLLYRRHTQWAALVRLLPSVVVGVLVGVAFVAAVGDTVMRRTIGVVLLALVAVHVLRLRGAGGDDGLARHPVAAAAAGSLAGFTTMVANAGGPVMTLYLLAARLDKLAFLGTAAWFFLLVNAAKVPFSVGLGLIGPTSLAVDAALAPLVLLGAAAGRWLVGRLDQARFEQLVLAATVLAALNLVR